MNEEPSRSPLPAPRTPNPESRTPLPAPRSPHHQLSAPLLAIPLLLLLSWGGLEQLFSSFARYDDEGYVLMSLRSYREGRPLYDATYTQYGPAYYMIESALHDLTGWPVTHDVARLKTWLCWLAVALASGMVVGCGARSTLLGGLSTILVFWHFDRLGLEPGHPQEICLGILALVALVFARGDWSRRLRRIPAALGLGILVGMLLLVKLNLGLFLGAGVALTLLVETRHGAVRTGLLGATAAATGLLPLLLFREHLSTAAGAALPIVVWTSLLATALWATPPAAARQAGHGALPLSMIGWFGAGLVATIAAVLTLTMAQGTSLSGVLDGLLREPARFANDFYRDPPLSRWSVLGALLSLSVAYALRRRAATARAQVATLVKIGQVAAAGLVGWIALAQFRESFLPISHGLQDRGGALALISFATPWLWLLLAAEWMAEVPAESRAFWLVTGRRFRLALAFIAAMQPLGICPTPGTQCAVGAWGLLLAALILTADVVTALRRQVGAPTTQWSGVGRFALVVVVLLALGTTAARDTVAHRRRAASVSLDLPGARWLRLPPAEAARWRTLAQLLREQATTFVTAPNGLNSVYLWSELAPPTDWNTTYWDVLLDESQQLAIVERLRAQPDARVVWDSANHRKPRDGALLRYLQESFPQRRQVGAWEIWAR